MKKLLVSLLLVCALLFSFAHAEQVVSGDYMKPQGVEVIDPNEEPVVEVNRSVSVYSNSFDAGVIYVGDTVTLQFQTSGFLDTDTYSITWQESTDGGSTWSDVGSSDTYSFSIDMTNKDYCWRVILTLQ
jgi:hypothetical protein